MCADYMVSLSPARAYRGKIVLDKEHRLSGPFDAAKHIEVENAFWCVRCL
jgi:hypothetical protein